MYEFNIELNFQLSAMAITTIAIVITTLIAIIVI